jgi:hypothetical protein
VRVEPCSTAGIRTLVDQPGAAACARLQRQGAGPLQCLLHALPCRGAGCPAWLPADRAPPPHTPHRTAPRHHTPQGAFMQMGQLIMEVGERVASLCDAYVARQRGASGLQAAADAGDCRDQALQQGQRQGSLAGTLRSSRWAPRAGSCGAGSLLVAAWLGMLSRLHVPAGPAQRLWTPRCSTFSSTPHTPHPGCPLLTPTPHPRPTRCPKGRLLHYFPLREEDLAGAKDDPDQWCGWHKDHGSLTGGGGRAGARAQLPVHSRRGSSGSAALAAVAKALPTSTETPPPPPARLLAGLTSAMYMREGREVAKPDSAAGLHISSRPGQVVQVAIPDDHIAYQVGRGGASCGRSGSECCCRCCPPSASPPGRALALATPPRPARRPPPAGRRGDADRVGRPAARHAALRARPQHARLAAHQPQHPRHLHAAGRSLTAAGAGGRHRRRRGRGGLQARHDVRWGTAPAQTRACALPTPCLQRPASCCVSGGVEGGVGGGAARFRPDRTLGLAARAGR